MWTLYQDHMKARSNFIYVIKIYVIIKFNYNQICVMDTNSFDENAAIPLN